MKIINNLLFKKKKKKRISREINPAIGTSHDFLIMLRRFIDLVYHSHQAGFIHNKKVTHLLTNHYQSELNKNNSIEIYLN